MRVHSAPLSDSAVLLTVGLPSNLRYAFARTSAPSTLSAICDRPCYRTVLGITSPFPAKLTPPRSEPPPFPAIEPKPPFPAKPTPPRSETLANSKAHAHPTGAKGHPSLTTSSSSSSSFLFNLRLQLLVFLIPQPEAPRVVTRMNRPNFHHFCRSNIP